MNVELIYLHCFLNYFHYLSKVDREIIPLKCSRTGKLKNMASIELRKSLDTFVEEDEEAEESDEAGSLTNTLKEVITKGSKPELALAPHTMVKKSAPAKQPSVAAGSTVKKRSGVLDSTIVMEPSGVDVPVIGSDSETDSSGLSENEPGSSFIATDSEPDRTGTSVDEAEDEDNMAGLTLGSTMAGTFDIPDDYWDVNCPFDKYMDEKDTRTRGLLLLVAGLQQQMKRTKASNVTNEMLVRKDLCDYFENLRAKDAEYHREKVKQMKKDFENEISALREQIKEYEERFRGLEDGSAGDAT